jgi:hypothetical protein
MRDPRLISILALIGYFTAARGVENLYPVSTFPMFSGAAAPAISRVMTRTASGELHEVTEFTSWQCDNLPHLDATLCLDVPSIPYIDREREDHIRSHPGAGAEPVELVRRIFSFDGVERPASCVIARCSATRR